MHLTPTLSEVNKWICDCKRWTITQGYRPVPFLPSSCCCCDAVASEAVSTMVAWRQRRRPRRSLCLWGLVRTCRSPRFCADVNIPARRSADDTMSGTTSPRIIFSWVSADPRSGTQPSDAAPQRSDLPPETGYPHLVCATRHHWSDQKPRSDNQFQIPREGVCSN